MFKLNPFQQQCSNLQHQQVFALRLLQQVRWATHKSGGSTSNGRNSNPKFLGFKKMNNAKVEAGNIILRQRGTQWHAGEDVGVGRDHTLFALKEGRVVLHYDLARQRRLVSISNFTADVQSSSIFLTSKTSVKDELKKRINVSLYLTLDPKGRYDHVREKIGELVGEMDKAKLQQSEVDLKRRARRPFPLSDLTMI